MNSFILIVIMHVVGGNTITTEEFWSKDTCDAAKKLIIEKSEFKPVYIACVEK